jgi:hypothetical protein
MVPVINLSESMSSQITVTTNLGTEVLITTRDKISNVLHTVLPKVRRRDQWVAPSTIGLSLVIALLSTDFNQRLFGLSAETWKAFFYVAAGLSIIWFVWALVGAIFRSAGHKEVLAAITKTHEASPNTTIQGTVAPPG